MVNVDTVYQKVLKLANKEQRGYITPQEFNLMADKAQLEIFNSYFHDNKTAHYKPKNDSNYSDEMSVLLEKLQTFKAETTGSTLAAGTNTVNFGSLQIPIYKLDSIILNYTPSISVHTAYRSDGTRDNGLDGPMSTAKAEELTVKEAYYAERNALTKATTRNPTFVREGGKILKLYPQPPSGTTVTFHYWRKPTTPSWAYVIVNGKPFYNYNNSVNFEIHISEEENLVMRILALCGIIIEDYQLAQLSMADAENTLNKQND